MQENHTSGWMLMVHIARRDKKTSQEISGARQGQSFYALSCHCQFPVKVEPLMVKMHITLLLAHFP
ncbi:hypothetical protein, partial [Mycobacterium tuberculosis]|uniref:hypothetical protein n=1 Tax=Mycobacterium tuberculosis TaxID=1773 RepID=UPI00255132BE